jgi:hypothetical protein
MTIAYICDCKAKCCDKQGCIKNGGPCSHTFDIMHSKNFNEVPIVDDNPSFNKLSSSDGEVEYFEKE